MQETKINLPDADLLYVPNYFSAEKSNVFLKHLLADVNWKKEKIRMFGKEIWQPRLTALFGDTNKPYTYSALEMFPTPFLNGLAFIKTKIEKDFEMNFNTCLANLYRDGNDSMGWHADDEKELGKNPVIASVSFGAERVFQLKHKSDKTRKFKLILGHGSLLIMGGTTQSFWKHQLPKTKKEIGPRINLTFRNII